MTRGCPRCGGWGINIGHPSVPDCSLCEGTGNLEREQVELWLRAHPQAVGEYVDKLRDEFWGVHITHCCFRHGCKYGPTDETNCPVALGQAKQDYPCEYCAWEEEEESYKTSTMTLEEAIQILDDAVKGDDPVLQNYIKLRGREILAKLNRMTGYEIQ